MSACAFDISISCVFYMFYIVIPRLRSVHKATVASDIAFFVKRVHPSCVHMSFDIVDVISREVFVRFFDCKVASFTSSNGPASVCR